MQLLSCKFGCTIAAVIEEDSQLSSGSDIIAIKQPALALRLA